MEWCGLAQSVYSTALYRLRQSIFSSQHELELSLLETDRALAELRARAV